MGAPAISDYALSGDCHGSALISRDGSIDWWSAPRFDAPAVFARLLDREAGHWSVRPVGEFEVGRRYVTDTMVMRTIFSTPTGRLALTDALALAPGERGHQIGYRSPHVLLRLVKAIEGEVEVDGSLTLKALWIAACPDEATASSTGSPLPQVPPSRAGTSRSCSA